jgi:hypothetical protein
MAGPLPNIRRLAVRKPFPKILLRIDLKAEAVKSIEWTLAFYAVSRYA